MAIRDLALEMLKELGEDPSREGLLKTPQRFENAMLFLTKGYREDLNTVINDAIFTNEYESEMIIVKDIELYSMCEHHLLPFIGKCHVGYLPDKKLIGLSKIPRIVDLFARRFQIQERLTTQIAETLDSVLSPIGVAVVIEASHLCSRMRGVEKQNSIMVTSSLKGSFKTNVSTRQEFMKLIGR